MSGFIRRDPYALAAGMLSSPVWIPLEEAEWRRGLLTHTVSALPRGLVAVRPPVVPFGWMAEKEIDRCAWRVGPWWYMWPRRIWVRYRWALHRLALKVGAAVAPYEGCYYSEIEWWPKGPRMTEIERWEARRATA